MKVITKAVLLLLLLLLGTKKEETARGWRKLQNEVCLWRALRLLLLCNGGFLSSGMLSGVSLCFFTDFWDNVSPPFSKVKPSKKNFSAMA